MSSTIAVSTRRGRLRRTSALLSASAIAATALIATAGSAGAAITQGPGTTADGLPASFQDSAGVAVVPCDAGADICGAAFDPATATYFNAGTDVGGIRVTYDAGAIIDPVDGLLVAQESRFGGRDLTPGRYTIKDPWGTINSCVADAGGRMDCRIAANRITSFLRATNAPAGFIGSHLAGPSAVLGSPTGFNQILITGPGGFRASSNRFDVIGQMRDNTAMSSVSRQSLTMGSRANKAPVRRVVRYSSFGTADATPTAVLSGANRARFRVQNTCGTVAPGSACAINVTYLPLANRTASAILTVRDNGLAAPRRIALKGTGPDTLAPKVMSSTPSRGATGVGLGKNVRVKFSEVVRGVKGSFTLVDNSTGRSVAARVSRVGKTRYLLNPRRALSPSTSYTVRLDGGRQAIRDTVGNGARDVAWRFRTR